MGVKVKNMIYPSFSFEWNQMYLTFMSYIESTAKYVDYKPQ